MFAVLGIPAQVFEIAVLGVQARVSDVAVLGTPPRELEASGSTAGEHTQVWDHNMREQPGIVAALEPLMWFARKPSCYSVELHDCGIVDKAAAAEEPARPSALVAVVDSTEGTEGTAADNYHTEPGSWRVEPVEYLGSHRDCKAFRTLFGWQDGSSVQVSSPMCLVFLAW